MPKIGILLLETGEPDSPAAVRPYLRAQLADRTCRRRAGGAWLQERLAGWRARRYAAAAGGHPGAAAPGHPGAADGDLATAPGDESLAAATRALAAALAAELERRGRRFPITSAMRYAPPPARAALAELAAAGTGSLLVLSLHPQFSWATSGSALDELLRAHAHLDLGWSMAILDHWYETPAYLRALADRVRATYASLGSPPRDTLSVIWCAHALPWELNGRGDPYIRQLAATRAGVVRRLGRLDLHHVLGHLRGAGPGRWTGPGIDAVLEEERRHGRRFALFVPVASLLDHRAVARELDDEQASRARALGFEHVVRAPGFGAGQAPELARLLADLVDERLGGVTARRGARAAAATRSATG